MGEGENQAEKRRHLLVDDERSGSPRQDGGGGGVWCMVYGYRLETGGSSWPEATARRDDSSGSAELVEPLGRSV